MNKPASDSTLNATRRLAAALRQAGISYAVVGGMAVRLHGHEWATRDVDVLLTQSGFAEFRRRIVGHLYAKLPGRPRKFVGNDHVTIDVVLPGFRSGISKTSPVVYPDPIGASETIDGVLVIELPALIQLKLGAGRFRDRGDVVGLIRTHNLDESYLGRLDTTVHPGFVECLEEKRREDEYEARECGE